MCVCVCVFVHVCVFEVRSFTYSLCCAVEFLPVAAVMVHISSNYEVWKREAEKIERATD